MRIPCLSLSVFLALISACNSGGPASGLSGSGSGTGAASGASSGSTGGPIDLVDGGIPEGANAWVAGFAQVACDAFFGCPAFSIAAGINFQDPTTCVATEVSAYLSLTIEAHPGEISTPSARLAQAQLCLSDLTALAADAGPCAVVLDFLGQYNQPPPATCLDTLAMGGTLAPGEPCISSFQCSSDRCERGSGCGVCGPPSPLLDGGAECVQYDDCALGLICSAGRCRTFVPEGQSCRAGDLCAPLTSCIDGICQPMFVAGQSCVDSESTQCQSQVCQNSVCTTFPIVPIGSICGYSTQIPGYVLCDPESSVCDVVDTGAQEGYCIARKGIGERCFVSKGFDGDDCVAGASCLADRCEPDVAACLDDGGLAEVVADAGPVVLPDASGDYAAALAAAEQNYVYICEGLANCPALAAYNAITGGSAAACEAALLPLEESSLNAPGVDPSSALAGQTACNAEVADLPPCLVASFVIDGYQSAACATSAGTLPAGAACAEEAQCASTNCSTSWTGTGCGVCGNVLDAGSSCLAASDCAGAQACTEGVCSPWGQLDAGCSAATPCAPQFVCVGGQCTNGLPAGSSCSPTNSLCNPDLICNAVTDECETVITASVDSGMNDAGQLDCGTLRSGSYALCPFGSACQLADTTLISGVCVPAAAPGNPCITNGSWAIGSSNCDWPSSCVNGLCGQAPLTVCQ